MLRTLLCLLAACLLLAACGDTTPDLTTSAEPVAQLARPPRPPVEPTTTTVPPPTTTTTVPEVATTTTMPPSPQVHTLAQPGPVVTAGSVNGYPCGGDLPTCRVLACESGGNPTAENPTSTASGLWQILDSTWAGFGGYSHAAHAPADVQNAKARQLWDGGAGRFHWAACL